MAEPSVAMERNNMDLRARLRICYESLTLLPLRRFLLGVLSNPEIRRPFFTLPASVEHHHSYAGGLLTHSLECAEMVATIPELESMQRDLGIVAALLHDIGKIPLLEVSGKRSKAGFLLHHETLTLEVLAPHLRLLDKAWEDGAIALRYLWCPAPLSTPQAPWMTVQEVVRAADRISASREAERMAFTGLPTWRHSAVLEVKGPKRRYWRPHPPTLS